MTKTQAELLRDYIDQRAYEAYDAAMSEMTASDFCEQLSDELWGVFVSSLAAEGE